MQQWTIYGLNALTHDHVNNFWGTSIPIHQTKKKSGGHLHWAQCCTSEQLYSIYKKSYNIVMPPYFDVLKHTPGIKIKKIQEEWWQCFRSLIWMEN